MINGYVLYSAESRLEIIADGIGNIAITISTSSNKQSITIPYNDFKKFIMGIYRNFSEKQEGE
jgi:hypothetical protein